METAKYPQRTRTLPNRCIMHDFREVGKSDCVSSGGLTPKTAQEGHGCAHAARSHGAPSVNNSIGRLDVTRIVYLFDVRMNNVLR